MEPEKLRAVVTATLAFLPIGPGAVRNVQGASPKACRPDYCRVSHPRIAAV